MRNARRPVTRLRLLRLRSPLSAPGSCDGAVTDVAARGRDLARLLARLGQLVAELATMADWLDEQGGNGRSEALITQAQASLLLANQQLMRDLEHEERRARRSDDSGA